MNVQALIRELVQQADWLDQPVLVEVFDPDGLAASGTIATVSVSAYHNAVTISAVTDPEIPHGSPSDER